MCEKLLKNRICRIAVLMTMIMTFACCSAAEPGQTTAESAVSSGDAEQGASASDVQTTDGDRSTETGESGSAAEERTSAEPTETETEFVPQPYLSEDLSTCLNWVNRTVEEAGIPGNCLANEGPTYSVTLEGALFGARVSGRLVLDGEDPLTVRQLELTSGELGYEDGLEGLKALFGEPLEEGEEPREQSDGGTIRWAVFQGDGAEIWLAQGSEQDFVTIQAY